MSLPEDPMVENAPQEGIVRRLAVRADLLDFTGAPAWGDTASSAVRFRPDHWLLIDDGRIVGVQQHDPSPGWVRQDHRGRLVLPGFIDAHVHLPQIDVIGSYGTELLDWLERHTFPAESRYADPVRSRDGAKLFIDALLAHGTTSAVVFPTSHKVSVDAVFEQAQQRGMRLVAGKVLQDRHSPDALRDDVVQAERDCADLIDRWHGVDRLAYAVTIRFAATSTPEQLAMAARLCAADPTLYFHTHLAENRAEVDWIAQLFPAARSYLDVYDSAGLLHGRSLFAHGIWIDARDRAALAASGAQIVHCPTSNLFLGSGLFDWRSAREAGVAVTLASDVGGGTSLSMVRTMAEAYKVQALRGERLTAWAALHGATLGAAQALSLSDEIGSLEPGRAADFCIWDWTGDAVAERRMSLAASLHERLFAWLTLADDRNLVETFVAGQSRYVRQARTSFPCP